MDVAVIVDVHVNVYADRCSSCSELLVLLVNGYESCLDLEESGTLTLFERNSTQR